MIREVVLRDFPNWSAEKQLAEFQAYKRLGSFSPFTEADYALMEMVINNPNAEVSVQCEDGVCEIIDSSTLLNEANAKDIAAEIDNHTKRDKIIHLLDILFDDNGEMLPDTEKLKAPTLLSALNGVIKDLSKSSTSPSKFDIFFDKNKDETKKGKTVNSSIYKVIETTKLSKVKFAKSDIGKLFAKYSDETGQISLEDLFSIPIIKILIYTAAMGKPLGTNQDTLSWFFDDEKLNLINSNVQLKEKIVKHTTKLSKVINSIFDGLDSHDSAVANNIDTNDELTDEEKNLQKLKLIGAEADEKKTKGTKISDEIRTSAPENKREVLLNKMGKTPDEVSKILDIISKSDVLRDASTPLTKGNVVSELNKRWEELIKVAPLLAVELYNKKFEGEGKGERLIEFLFPTVFVNGGSKSFDLSGTGGSNDFEVKAYEFDSDGVVKPIKLGVEGKATQSDLFNEIQVVIAKLQDIFSDPNHYEVLKFMINGLNREDELEKLVNKISKTLTSNVPNTKRTFKEALSSGEFSAVAITSINDLLTDLNQLFELIKENDFFYMKVIGKQNEIYKIVDSEISNENTIFTATKTTVKKEQEQKVIESILDVLGNKNMSSGGDFFTRVLMDLETKINSEFKNHPMIVLYDTSGNDADGNSTGIAKLKNIAEGLYSEFKIQAITRGNVAVMPTEQYYKKYGNAS